MPVLVSVPVEITTPTEDHKDDYKDNNSKTCLKRMICSFSQLPVLMNCIHCRSNTSNSFVSLCAILTVQDVY